MPKDEKAFKILFDTQSSGATLCDGMHFFRPVSPEFICCPIAIICLFCCWLLSTKLPFVPHKIIDSSKADRRLFNTCSTKKLVFLSKEGHGVG